MSFADDMSLRGSCELDSSGMISGIDEIINHLDKLERAGESAGNALSSGLSKGIGGSSELLGGVKGQLASEASNFRSTGTGIGQSLIGGMTSQFGAAGQAAGQLATTLGPVGVAAMAAGAGIIAVGSAVSSSVNTAANFQQSMANVTAIMGGSEAEMQAMSAAARDAGATTQYSATQAAQALSYMAGAGWNSTQATAGLKDTLTMAAAGGMDLAAAGDLMTGTIAQFNLQATDAGRVSNVLAAGASATNTSISQLGAGMNVVGSTANTFDMSLEETTAALGSLSNANIKGAEGGTALRGILASLATQTGPAAAALSELGLSAADVNPETNTLSDTMQLLEERGMTATQAIAIFGRENVSAATYLAAHSSELDGLQASITGTSKASEMAAIQTNTYQGAMGELSSAVEEAQISLGDALLPSLTSGVQLFTEFVQVGTAAGEALYDFASDVNTTLAPVKEAFSYTPMGLVAGAVSDTASGVWDDLKAWAGIGDEAGSAVAEGVADNKDLATSPADAMTSGTGKAAMKDAAGVSAKEFSKTWIEEFETQQADREIAKILARSGELTVDKGNIAGSVTTELENGLEIQVVYQGNSESIMSRLFIDGQQIGDTVYGANREESARKLLDTYNQKYNEGNILDITGKTGEAKLWRLNQSTQIEFDYTGISAIFGNQFVSRLENEGSRISQTASKEVQNTYQSLLDALKEPTWDNLDEVLGQMDSLVAEHELDPSEAALWAENYKQELLSGITDIEQFSKSQATSLNSTIADAFSDFDFSESDRKLVLAMKPMLDAVKAESPKAFGESGLAGIDKFIEMVENGASSSELYAYFKTLGTKAGNSFAEAMNSNFGEIDFDWNKMWGKNFLSSLSDLDAFAKNMFQPELIELSSDALERYNTGTDEYILQSEQMVDTAVKLAEENKWLFTDEDYDALMKYKDGAMSLGSTLNILADKADDSGQEVKKFAQEVEDADDECGKLISTFGAWQEMNSSLWKSNYIGSSWGEDYDNALVANAAYYYVAAASSQRYADSRQGIVNAKSEELRVAELLLEKSHAGTLSDEDRALAVRTFGIELTATNEKAATLAETLANFDNTFQGDITRTISFEGDPEPHNEIVSTLTLDTVTALSEYESFRANIEGTVITAKLSTQIETTADRVSSQLQGIDFDEEQTATRKISFKTTTPGLSGQGNQTGTQDSSAILQNIYMSLDRNTNRQILALTSQAAITRTFMTMSTTNVTNGITSATETLSNAINDAAVFIVDSILNNQGGSGSGISDSTSSESSSFWSGTTPLAGTSGALFSYSEGGYVDKPTFAVVGDSPGGEYMVPAEKLDNFLMGMSQSNASVGLSLDSSSLQEQLQQAVRSISVPAIPVPVKLSFDSDAIKSQLTSILYDIFAEMR